MRVKNSLIIVLSFVAAFFPFSGVMAWDSTGHKVVAQIAYEHLTPHTKRKVNQLIHHFAKSYPRSNTFVNAASWADVLHFHDVSAFDHWHYIDKPFSLKKTPVQQPNPDNVVRIINQSEKVLLSKSSNTFEKAFFLRFLIHTVGDIHQPLHCISLFSPSFPEGDRGGQLYLLNDKKFSNLHRLWDAGVGYFSKGFHNYPLNKKQIRYLAHKIERKYPEKVMASLAKDLEVNHWASEGYKDAISYVYQVKQASKPSQKYIEQGQVLVQKRIALAGYRLANDLNRIFDVQGH